MVSMKTKSVFTFIAHLHCVVFGGGHEAHYLVKPPGSITGALGLTLRVDRFPTPVYVIRIGMHTVAETHAAGEQHGVRLFQQRVIQYISSLLVILSTVGISMCPPQAVCLTYFI